MELEVRRNRKRTPPNSRGMTFGSIHFFLVGSRGTSAEHDTAGNDGSISTLIKIFGLVLLAGVDNDVDGFIFFAGGIEVEGNEDRRIFIQQLVLMFLHIRKERVERVRRGCRGDASFIVG